MSFEVDSEGVLREVKTMSGIVLRNEQSGHTVSVGVYDKFPQMGDVHIEGRRVVELSVEAYVELMGFVGYAPVDPNENEPVDEGIRDDDDTEREDG